MTNANDEHMCERCYSLPAEALVKVGGKYDAVCNGCRKREAPRIDQADIPTQRVFAFMDEVKIKG